VRVVVCGGGTAGCVVARRLVDAGCEVVLLEAGPHYPPGQWPLELTHSHRIIKESHDWGYFAKAGASPRIVHVPRGRVVGGSSVTNGAIALRGHPEHYDEWDQYVDGYGWESWLPWFAKIEADGQFGDQPEHGSDGLIPINRYPRDSWLEIAERFYTAAIAAGHQEIGDHNHPGAIGIGPVPLNMVDGVRQVPADHYLAAVLDKVTLRDLVSVDRIELDGTRARAVHIVDAAGRTERIEADAVIVTLGTYATPALLMRSGIGPAGEITRHGIPHLHELSGVGRGMMDHPKVSYRFTPSITPPTWPYPWYQCLLTGEHRVAGERRVYQVMPYAGTTEAGQPIVDINTQIADARSRRGMVRLQSIDPRDQPVLDMGWFLEPSDRQAAVAAGERLMEVATQRPLAEILTPWPNIADPDQVLRTVETFHHPVASCRMGRDTDPEAVVSSDGRVLGLDDLFIMDASVMARVPSANTHLATIALAERLVAGML
jgi:choline dehydrogenase